MTTTSTRALVFAALLIVSGARPRLVTAQGPILELDHAYLVVPPGAAAAVQPCGGSAS